MVVRTFHDLVRDGDEVPRRGHITSTIRIDCQSDEPVRQNERACNSWQAVD